MLRLKHLATGVLIAVIGALVWLVLAVDGFLQHVQRVLRLSRG